MEQQGGGGDLLEGGPEGLDQVRRQVVDKAHRVREQDFPLHRNPEAAARRFQRFEHPLPGGDPAAGQPVQQGGLAGVRVTHQRDHRQSPGVPALAAEFADAGHPLQVALQPADALPGAAAVHFQAGFAGAAAADAAAEPREGSVPLGQPGQPVAQLGQFHLQPPFPAFGAAGEHIEDELGPVEHLEIGGGGDVPPLGRREVRGEEQRVGPPVEGADDERFQFPAAEERPGVGAGAALDHPVHHLQAGVPGQLGEFRQRLLERDRSLHRAHQHRAPGESPAGALGEDPGVGALDLGDDLQAVEVEPGRGRGREPLPRLRSGFRFGRIRPGRLQVGGVHQPGEPVLADGERRHQVEAEQHQVGEVVPAQVLVGEVGMEAAQAAQPRPGDALALQVREFDAVGVADSHPGHRAPTVHQDAHLAADGAGDGGQLPGELLRQERGRRQPPVRQAVERPPLPRLQPGGVALDPQGRDEPATPEPERAGRGSGAADARGRRAGNRRRAERGPDRAPRPVCSGDRPRERSRGEAGAKDGRRSR